MRKIIFLVAVVFPIGIYSMSLLLPSEATNNPVPIPLAYQKFPPIPPPSSSSSSLSSYSYPTLSQSSAASIDTIKNKCLKHILERNIRMGNLVMMLRNVSEMLHDDLVSFTMTLTNVILVNVSEPQPMIKWRMTDDGHFFHGIHFVSLYLLESNIELVAELINVLVTLRDFDSRARFMLAIDAKKYALEKNQLSLNLSKIFRNFWSFSMYNVLVLICWENCEIYTWFPYDKTSKCGTNFENFVKILECKRSNETMMVADGMSVGGDGGNNAKRTANISSGNNISHGSCLVINYAEKIQILYGNISSYKRCQDVVMSNKRQAENFNKENWGKSDLHQGVFSFFDDADEMMEAATATASFEQQNWDRKYVKEFFAYNYRPYGMIEFRSQGYCHYAEANESSNVYQWGEPDFPFQRQQRRLYNRHFRDFYDKIPSNLNRCKFNGLLFVWPPFVTPEYWPWIGIEHKLLLDVSRYMNFEIVEKYVTVNVMAKVGDKGSQHVNKELSILAMMRNYSADLAFGNIYPNVKVHEYFDNTLGYLFDHVNWVVPLAADQPLWLNLIKCFR